MKFTRDQLDIAIACRVQVLLDGVPRSRVVAADEEGRTIQILRHDGRRYVLSADRTGVEVDTLCGDVTIIVPPENAERLRRALNPPPKPVGPPNETFTLGKVW